MEGLSRTEKLAASPPMFESRFLDRFTRVHWSVPLIIYLPVIGVLLYMSLWVKDLPVLPVIGLVIIGFFLWTLLEYWLHRLVFHFQPRNEWQQWVAFMIHGVHHDHPNDPKRLVMPPGASIPLALIFLGLFRLVFGSVYYMPTFAGLLIGYLFYDMGHYHYHHHVPRTKLGKRLRENHMRHHFQDHHEGYGVSSPFWDHIFGTLPEKKS